jgi:hypothetical protein
MAHLQIDSIGEFPTDEDGNQHAITIIDRCTRYTMLYAAKSTEAVDGAAALLNWMQIFENPITLTSDKGTQYVNRIIKELCDITGIDHKITVAGSKQENAIVERANDPVTRHLAAFRYELKTVKSWGKLLPIVNRIMNNTYHESVGCTPNELVFGGLHQKSAQIISSTENVNLGKYTAELLHMQQKFLDRANIIQYGIDSVNLAKRQPTQPVTEFPIGSLVLLEYPETRLGKLPPTKLHTRNRGPFKVHDFKGSSYTLKNLVVDKLEPPVHVSRLRPFVYDVLGANPAKIAQADTLEWEVEKILQHVGDIKKISTLDFQVRWLGQPPERDLWLPWKELRNNPILHQYLMDNGMHKLIPKEHKTLEQIRTLRNQERALTMATRSTTISTKVPSMSSVPIDLIPITRVKSKRKRQRRKTSRS